MQGGFDLAVIGGGMVGSAIAYGCAMRGARVALLDEGDVAFRASRANFGLVWGQSKGEAMPAYAAWTKLSIALWRDFAERASSLAGRDVQYVANGGLNYCLGEQEFAEKGDFVRRRHNQGWAGMRLLDRRELQAMMPATPLGPEVMGAIFDAADGQVNPLTTFRAMHAGVRAHGGVHLPGAAVTAVERTGAGFVVTRADGAVLHAAKVVVAAGVATQKIAAMVGLDVPVRPVRGQNIVTERLAPMLPLPASALRQTSDGTVQIGVTNEDDGRYEIPTTAEALARMARRAIRVLPALEHANMIRTWAGLRPMTPDSFPAYAESETHPGAYVAICHSGVTLAAVHAGPLAEGILSGRLPDLAQELHPRRFHVPTH